MTESIQSPPQGGRFDPAALADNPPSRLAEIGSAALTIATIVAIAIAADRLSFAQIFALVPSTPLFWVAFAFAYLSSTLAEWVIFRRLWAIPFEGFVALLRKYVLNEVVLDYLGEAKFYAWARSRLSMTTSPFGAVKDVAILSAMASNVLTMILLLAVWPLVASNSLDINLQSMFLALGVVLASSFAVLFFRKRLFSLPVSELRFITAVHIVRLIGNLGLTALMWHLVLPEIALTSWVILATLRMLVSRLPLVANKDLLFSVVTLYALGSAQPHLASLLAMMAGLILVTHIVVGTVCAAAELFSFGRSK